MTAEPKPHYDPHNPKPGTSFHKSNRHKSRMARTPWTAVQWEAAKRMIPDDGEVEIQIEAGLTKKMAWHLGDQLRAELRAHNLAGNGAAVLVTPRPWFGWGVYLVLGHGGPGHKGE